MAETPPDLLEPDGDEEESEALRHLVDAGRGSDSKPKPPPEPHLSPIAKRAWSLASEAVEQLDFLHTVTKRWYLSAEAAGVDRQRLETYREEGLKLHTMWSSLISTFRLHSDIEPSLRPLDNRLVKRVAGQILDFRRHTFYNRYRMVFARLDVRGTIWRNPFTDKDERKLLDYWSPMYEAMMKEKQGGALPAMFAHMSPSTAFRLACEHLSIDESECMEEIHNFVRRGLFSPDILSLIKERRLDLVREHVMSDIRDFAFIFHPNEVEYTRRLMVGNTLNRILSRWSVATSAYAYEATPQYYEDQERLNSLDVVKTYSARMRIADEIVQSISSWDPIDREGLFVRLLVKELFVVDMVGCREEFGASWMQKSAERCTLMTAELRMMIDLIQGDKTVGKSQFGMYGEGRRPLDKYFCVSPLQWE